MSCLGVTGKPIVVIVKCGVESDILGSEWESYASSWYKKYKRVLDNTWTTYYGKDFTRIVLELIDALEQRIRVGNHMWEESRTSNFTSLTE